MSLCLLIGREQLNHQLDQEKEDGQYQKDPGNTDSHYFKSTHYNIHFFIPPIRVMPG